MKNDCAYKEKCMQIMTTQMLAMYAGRSLACTPSCEYCNNYKPINEEMERHKKIGYVLDKDDISIYETSDTWPKDNPYIKKVEHCVIEDEGKEKK